MKAIVYSKYGPPEVLQWREVEKPVPKDKEILIKVYATTVNYGDITARNFRNISPREFNLPFLFWLLTRIYFGIGKPQKLILGSELSGEIESVGKDVQRFKKGDRVFGYPGQKMGAYAEYLCMPENGCVTMKPVNVNDEEAAAAVYGPIMALGLLRKVKIQPGQKVLINGASGNIGSAAVQIAKNIFGAEVTGVCSTPRVEFVKSLGADKVIDYTKEDFAQNGETYDLIFEVLGKSLFCDCQNSLTQNGVYLYASFKLRQLLLMGWTSMIGKLFRQSGKRVICAIAPGSLEDLNSIKELIEAGKIKSIIDKRFPLVQAAEAHLYIENGQKKGSVVLTP